MRRILIALSLAAALTAAPTAFLGFLSSLWSESGASFDPDGASAPQSDEGPELDPDGRPTPATDEGPQLDPNG